MACRGNPECGGKKKGGQVTVRTEPVIRPHTKPKTVAARAPNIMVRSEAHRLILENWQAPGDVLMMTAAIRDLHRAYPGRFLTEVRTTASEIWQHNPKVVRFKEAEGAKKITLGYTDMIMQSNTGAHHFVHGFVHDLEKHLGIRIPCTDMKGEVYISDEERKWMPQPAEAEHGGYSGDFWLVAAGGKYDYTAKWWHPDYYQEVVDHFKGRVTFVQIGRTHDHFHTPLKGVINLTGRTTIRQLLRLVYHSVGVLCPVTFLMHAAAAVPTRQGYPPFRAGVVVAGGREPAQWEAYPAQRFLSNQGALTCCQYGGCWKSRATLVNDQDKKNLEVCTQPVVINPKTPYPRGQIKGDLRIGRCMDMIRPRAVIDAIETYYEGGALKYNK